MQVPNRKLLSISIYIYHKKTFMKTEKQFLFCLNALLNS